jgi:hypothetical protein
MDEPERLSTAERALIDARAATAKSEALAAAAECAEAMRQLTRRGRLEASVLSESEAMTIRRCIGDYARSLKTLGLSPESVIVNVKRLVHDTETTDRDSRRLFMNTAVTWAIEAYYSTHRE